LKKEGLLYGALILLISNFLVKCLGFFYRVVLVRVLGTEGIGLVEMVVPIYAFVLVIATWGIPLAMSKQIAEEAASGRYGNVRRIFSLTLKILFSSGIICTALVYRFSPLIISHFAADQRIYFCFMTMVPAIFIIAVCSVFRAYFQGIKQVSAIGISQTIEQSIRVMVGVTLAIKLKKYGLEVAVIAVALATVLGEFSGLAYMIARYRSTPKMIPQYPPDKSSWSIFKDMISFGTPVTLTRLWSTLLLALQASLIPRGLIIAGNDLRTATEMYGRFSGVALTLLHLPGTLTMALAISIIPAVAELMGSQNKRLLNHRVSEALQITTVFTLPGMIVLFFYPRELCQLIFHAGEAGEPLKILAAGGIFFYLQQTLSSILQGMGHVKVLLFNLMGAGICLIIGIVLLTPIPTLGISGAAMAMSTSFFIGSMLNLHYLITRAHLRLQLSNFIIKPFTAAILTYGLMTWLDRYLRQEFSSEILVILSSVSIGVLGYFFILVLMKGLPYSTLKRLPIINKFFHS